MVKRRDFVFGIAGFAGTILINSLRSNIEKAQAQNSSPIYVLYVNGIRTPNVKFEQDMELVRRFFAESSIPVAGVDGVLNPTGLTLGVGDLFESIVQDFLAHGSPDKKVVNGVLNKIKSIDNNLRSRYPRTQKAKFLLVGHSQGTFFIEEIADYLQSYYPDIASRTSLLALSPFTSFKKIRLRKMYLLRKDDFPKAHLLARFGIKGCPHPNLPPLVTSIVPIPFISLQSHRLDYYLGSLTNHFEKFDAKYIKSINLAQNTAAQYIKELLNYNTGVY